jgi:hypothetical protein
MLAAQLLVKVSFDEVETLVEGIERACKPALSGSHLAHGSAEREALAVLRVSDAPFGGTHHGSILERAAGRFIRTKPKKGSVLRRAHLVELETGGVILDAGHLTPPSAARCPRGR